MTRAARLLAFLAFLALAALVCIGVPALVSP